MAAPPRQSDHRGLDPGKDYRATVGLPIVPALDGFRAIAILGVVIAHLIGMSTVLESEASRALVWGAFPPMIELLFIVSGFVLFLPTVARNGDFGSVRIYAVRRSARLLPAFWLAIAVGLAMIAMWPASPAPAWPAGSDIAVHVLFLHIPAEIFDGDLVTGLSLNGPLWTLSHEMLFYVLLPVVAGLYFRHPIAGLAIAAAISVGWKLGSDHTGAFLAAIGIEPTGETLRDAKFTAHKQFPSHLFNFAVGMTAAWAYARLHMTYPVELLEKHAGRVQIVSFAAFLVMAYLFGNAAATSSGGLPALARQDPLISLGIGATLGVFMLSTSLCRPRRQIPFALGPVRSLGDISYGIYLIHAPMMVLVLALFLNTGTLASLGVLWTLVLFALPLIFLYAWVTARWFEQPLRRLAHTYKKPTPAPAAPARAAAGGGS